MKNKICIITGANSGIGKVTALELAKLGATIIMVCRNSKKGEEALAEIVSKSKNDNVHLMLCDFASQKSIRYFVEEFKVNYDRLDILINNAGFVSPKRNLTKDGIEETFAVNHLGYFLLTNLLIEKIKKSDSGRIINVSSAGHWIGDIDFDNLNSEKGYNSFKVYCNSKLANIVFTRELARRLEGTNITVNCLHPGAVNTNFASNMNSKFNFLSNMFKSFMITPEQGAETQIYLATSPDVQNITGQYFDKKKIAKSSKKSVDKELAQKLWKVSEQMTDLDV